MNKGTEKRERRRQELIEEAIKVLAHHGVEATTLERVGKKFEMKRSLVAYYFKNREELLLSAARHVTQTAQAITIERVRQATEWKSQIRAVIDGALDWFERYPDQVTVFLLFYYFCSYDPKLKKIQTEIRSQGAERLSAIISEGLAPKSKANARRAAQLIQALITGEIVDKAVTDHKFSFNESSRQLYEASLAILRDLKP